MRIIRLLDESTKFVAPILTLGTYDGVHLGHQQIIKSLVERAKSKGVESVLFTFDPHPRKVLYPDTNSVQLIDTMDEKLAKLKDLGLDSVILFPFTIPFSRLSAMEFVRDVLVNQIGVSEVHIGHDHHFGKNREGSYLELKELGELFNFEVHQIGPVQDHAITISSTKIRNAIILGDVKTANDYLGTSFRITGKVVKGKQLGRTIGFPTANIGEVDSDKILPKHGVYAVRVICSAQVYSGVMNVGVKPTFSDHENVSLEVYIFGFNENIYDQVITVEFVQYIREEKRFDTIDELVNQIREDEKTALTIFA